jgi:cytochrome oxidase assembly protein ShyY1
VDGFKEKMVLIYRGYISVEIFQPLPSAKKKKKNALQIKGKKQPEKQEISNV